MSDHTAEPKQPLIGELLSDDEYQQQIADKITVEVFESEANAEKTTNIIRDFIKSYAKNKDQQPLEEWLSSEFRKYPDLWQNDAEIDSTSREVIAAVNNANQTKQSLNQHLEQGKSQASWVANQIEQGAAATGAINVSAYVNNIDQALNTANQKNWDVLTRQDGAISQARNLDGFIAEHHHANTFNIDAATKESSFRAEVKDPNPGEPFGKNSMDIGVYDENGKLVKRYQSKYGADAEASAELFKKGDYRGQGKLVPEGHAIDDNMTEVIEIDGVSSKPLSKEKAKQLQEKAQLEQEAKQYEWNDTNRIDIAKQIGKQALMGACITAGFQGSRILARRVWNSITGKTNPSADEDLQEFFESSLKSAGNTGIQVAVSGGLVIAAKNGLLGSLLKATPAGRIAEIAYIGLENAKILYKFGKGELSITEALDAMQETTVSAALGIAGAVEGAALGASLGTVLGPVGTAVGGFVGGVVGGIAGSNIGLALHKASKAIMNTAVDTIKSIASSVGSGIKNIATGIQDTVSILMPWNW